jgi:xanthine/uracil/vitamin C permease (AzgA family)
VRGAVLIGILAVTIVSIAMGFTPFGGVTSMPPSLARPSCNWTSRARWTSVWSA